MYSDVLDGQCALFKKNHATRVCTRAHKDADLRGIKVAVVYFAALNGFLAIILFLYRVLAARLYAATIAAALVRHGQLITSQRGEALARAFSELEADPSMTDAIRVIAAQALTAARRA